MSEAKSIVIYLYASSPDAAAWMLKFVFAYLANTAVLCYSLTIICCCQVQDYIYWIISTNNDHRHHHKFIKYEKRLRKEEKTCSVYLSSKIGATSARVWTRSTSLSLFQRSNWSPTYILHLFHLEDTSLLFIFLSESVKIRFLSRVDTFSFAKNHMLFIVSKQCACSIRVHIEGDMNRFEFLSSRTIILITIVVGLFCRIFCSITRC
jgi:hypothetical protein